MTAGTPHAPVALALTGRREREFKFPVGYRRDGEVVKMVVGRAERKVWCAAPRC
jgi:hypothetical protein